MNAFGKAILSTGLALSQLIPISVMHYETQLGITRQVLNGSIYSQLESLHNEYDIGDRKNRYDSVVKKHSDLVLCSMGNSKFCRSGFEY